LHIDKKCQNIFGDYCLLADALNRQVHPDSSENSMKLSNLACSDF